MLIFMASLMLWFLAIVTDSMFGGFIHLLLVVAAVAGGISIIQYRKVEKAKRRW